MRYLALVGEQPMPVLLPLWQDVDACDEVQLIATRRTRAIADDLAAVIRQDEQLKVLRILDAISIDAYDLPQAAADLRELLVAAAQPVLFNLTGGTKIMSLAAVQASRGTDAQLLYVSTENRSLVYLKADSPQIEVVPIYVKISVYQYFAAHGFESSNSQNFAYRRSDLAPPKEGDDLEAQVYHNALRSGAFDDVQRNVFIRKQLGQQWVSNELDVVLIKNGNLAVCSCKSGKKVGVSDLNELASLSRRESFGIYCGKVLVMSDLRPKPGLINRARAYQIQLVPGGEVNNVVDYILASVH